MGEECMVVAMMGREFLMTEHSWPEVEQVLAAASWGVRQLAKYTMYLPTIEIALTYTGMAACVRLREVHARL